MGSIDVLVLTEFQSLYVGCEHDHEFGFVTSALTRCHLPRSPSGSCRGQSGSRRPEDEDSHPVRGFGMRPRECGPRWGLRFVSPVGVLSRSFPFQGVSGLLPGCGHPRLRG